MRTQWMITLALLGAIGALASTNARAMRVTPIELEMRSTGSGSRGAISVTNNSSEPLPLEVSIRRFTQDEDGNRKMSEAGESEFLVLPPQALLAPGATQVFRVQWVGEPVLEASQSFILYFTQVPVKLPPGRGATVQVIVSLGCIVNVAPPQGLPDLKVAAAGIEVDKDGRRHPFVTVENPTSVHALLSQAQLRLTGSGWSMQMTSGELSEKIGIGLVEPRRRRRFKFPVELPGSVTSIWAAIEFKPAHH